MRTRLSFLIAVMLMSSLPPALARADAPTMAESPRPEDTRGRFSFGRLLLNTVAGAAVGSLASYGVYEALCSSDDCLWPALAAVGTNFVVTPLAVYGTGNALGGRGGLAMTYYGGVVALAPFSADPTNETLQPGHQLAIAVVLLPLTTALMYELSSSIRSKARPSLSVRPIVSQGGLAGGIASAGIAF